MRRFIASVILGSALHTAWAADPGASWFTESGSGVPPRQVQWLAAESLCRVLPERLSRSVQSLASKPFIPLTAKALAFYGGAACKGQDGQRPYLVRAVTTAGEGTLDAGRLDGDLWMRYSALGGAHPFEKTPVILWLDAPPASVHISVSLVE
jgi:hypothetical protein